MTNTERYRGTAVVVATTREITVRADLYRYKNGQHCWRGHLEAADPSEDFWDVVDALGGTLRLPDGQERTFVPALSLVVGSGQLSITGSGAAPF